MLLLFIIIGVDIRSKCPNLTERPSTKAQTGAACAISSSSSSISITSNRPTCCHRATILRQRNRRPLTRTTTSGHTAAAAVSAAWSEWATSPRRDRTSRSGTCEAARRTRAVRSPPYPYDTARKTTIIIRPNIIIPTTWCCVYKRVR